MKTVNEIVKARNEANKSENRKVSVFEQIVVNPVKLTKELDSEKSCKESI